MARIALFFFIGGLLFAPISAQAAQDKIHKLPQGASLTTHVSDEVVLDRQTLDEISLRSEGAVNPKLEAYWAHPAYDVFFENEPVGYVKMDDWGDLDVDALWDSYIEGARQQSLDFGYEVKPLRWIIEPTLNHEHAVAYYAFEIQFGDEPPLVNMVIYDFGRHGYEEMTMVQDSSAFAISSADFIARSIADAYDFGPGSDYADFSDGDTVAAVGAAGLVAAAFGTKTGRGFLAGLFATILIFAKKLWFLLLIIPAAIWKIVSGRKDDDEVDYEEDENRGT